MIQARKDLRGRPSSRPTIATCDTAREAMHVVRALRAQGITSTWASNKPYQVKLRNPRHLQTAHEFVRRHLHGTTVEA